MAKDRTPTTGPPPSSPFIYLALALITFAVGLLFFSIRDIVDFALDREPQIVGEREKRSYDGRMRVDSESCGEVADEDIFGLGVGVEVEKDHKNGVYVGEEVAKAINKVMVEKNTCMKVRGAELRD